MKTFIALVVALVAFLSPASAQVQYLHSQQVLVDYTTNANMAIEACTLAPNAPVQVEVFVDVRWWYLIQNNAWPVSGYQYGRGLNVTLHSCNGDSTLQLCNNICSGALATGQIHESLMEVGSIPLGGAFVTTAAQIPTEVSYAAYGAMQDWPGIAAPWITQGRRPPWTMTHRTWGMTTLKVTPL